MLLKLQAASEASERFVKIKWPEFLIQLVWVPAKASLVAQTVKNLPAVQETRFQSLGWEDPWRREWLPTPVSLPGEFHGMGSLEGYTPWGHKESDMTERLTLSLSVVPMLLILGHTMENHHSEPHWG